MESKCKFCGTCRWHLYVRAIEDSICDNLDSQYYTGRMGWKKSASARNGRAVMRMCGVSKCPDTHPEILCQLCDLWYPYGGAVCKHMFERWHREEQEVRDLHKAYMDSKRRKT